MHQDTGGGDPYYSTMTGTQPESAPRALFGDRGDALLIVDVQCDFLPGGALAVPDGDAVVPALNRALARAEETAMPVYASRDWHPPNHCSFREQGGPWPSHCVAGSPGAQFAPGLRLTSDTRIVDKARSAEADAYSAFDGTGLAQTLEAEGVRRVVVGGLATDYCVLATVRDALRAGFEVIVLTEAVRAVDVHPGDGEKALAEMRAAGAQLVPESDPVP
jgi:nicotinamidase/pyrazinamidase